MFVTVEESDVLVIFKDQDTGEEISVSPLWIVENGIPVTSEFGDDCSFIRTEVNVNTIKEMLVS